MYEKSRYRVELADNSVIVGGRPHQFEIEGQPDWLVEIAYDSMGGRRTPVRLVRRSPRTQRGGRWKHGGVRLL